MTKTTTSGRPSRPDVSEAALDRTCNPQGVSLSPRISYADQQRHRHYRMIETKKSRLQKMKHLYLQKEPETSRVTDEDTRVDLVAFDDGLIEWSMNLELN